MAQKALVDALMKEHNISRTMANNMVRKRAGSHKDKTGKVIIKRVSITHDEPRHIEAYRKLRKGVIAKRHKTTTTIRKHKTSRIKSTDTAQKKSR